MIGLEWETLGGDAASGLVTERARVFGGWLVRVGTAPNAMSLAFVPDGEGRWDGEDFGEDDYEYDEDEEEEEGDEEEEEEEDEEAEEDPDSALQGLEVFLDGRPSTGGDAEGQHHRQAHQAAQQPGPQRLCSCQWCAFGRQSDATGAASGRASGASAVCATTH